MNQKSSEGNITSLRRKSLQESPVEILVEKKKNYKNPMPIKIV